MKTIWGNEAESETRLTYFKYVQGSHDGLDSELRSGRDRKGKGEIDYRSVRRDRIDIPVDLVEERRCVGKSSVTMNINSKV